MTQTSPLQQPLLTSFQPPQIYQQPFNPPTNPQQQQQPPNNQFYPEQQHPYNLSFNGPSMNDAAAQQQSKVIIQPANYPNGPYPSGLHHHQQQQPIYYAPSNNNYPVAPTWPYFGYPIYEPPGNRHLTVEFGKYS